MPEEIISLVLKHLVTTAEEQLMGRRVTAVLRSSAACSRLVRHAEQRPVALAGAEHELVITNMCKE